MMRDPVKVLLGNLSISNLLCAVFVQLISAILGGYAISINDYQVTTISTYQNMIHIFQVVVEFCHLWDVARRATWAVLPATCLLLHWLLLLPQVKLS